MKEGRRIIENFLPEEDFKNIVHKIYRPSFGWNYNECVAFKEPENDDNFYFTHTLYDWGAPQCSFFDDVFFPSEVVLKQKADIGVKSIIRMKCNLYTRTEKILQHDMHVDYDFNHIACILGINDCDGFTLFEDGDKIPSKANQLIIFDGFDRHCSTTCTNAKARININFNLF